MNDEMDTYADIIESKVRNNVEKFREEFNKIGEYYENKLLYGKSAEAFRKCDNYKRALKLYIKAGEKYLDNAIEMVGDSKDESLMNSLLN